MNKISAVIISFNEEKDIGRCLGSVTGIADEVLVLDSFSTDETEAICRNYGARFEQHVFDGYGSQKNRAVQMATHDYILSLDADEALSNEARSEVSRVKKEWSHDGYIFNRRNNYCGHWMRFTTWYPDRKLRLFDRRKAACVGLDLHEYMQMAPGGTSRRMKGDILHWTVRSKEEHLAKMEQFSRISAKFYFDQGIRRGIGSALVHCVWHWFREYCINLGILDGKAGWQVARYSALYVWKKYYYLRKLYGSQR
ncbi:MAG: glycosyltransferase family 2 protein [Bacteroidia bacterium]|nr:glycosyltransferase family 2 protein [Bacteroidia bacterium]